MIRSVGWPESEGFASAVRDGRAYLVSTSLSVGLGLFWNGTVKNTGSSPIVIERVESSYDIDDPVLVTAMWAPTAGLPAAAARTVSALRSTQAASGLELRTEAGTAAISGGVANGGFMLAGLVANVLHHPYEIAPGETFGWWTQYAAAVNVGLTLVFWRRP